MVTEPVKTFNRKFLGYDQAAVDAHIEVLTTKQRLLRDDVESLRTRLRESGDEVAALRKKWRYSPTPRPRRTRCNSEWPRCSGVR